MKTLIEKLKEHINDDRASRGGREKVLVGYRLLMEILHQADRDNTFLRATANTRYMQLEEILHNTVQAMFHEKGRDSAIVILDVMTPVLIELEKIRSADIRTDALKGGCTEKK